MPTIGHNDVRCDEFILGFYELNDENPEQVKDVHVIVQRHGSEEVYDGCLAVILLLFCVHLFLYVGLYENVDVDTLYEAGFFKDVLSITYDINKDTGNMHSFNYT